MSNLRADKVGPSAGGTLRELTRGVSGAWVNFNGAGTVAVRDSVNIASITDNGAGDYTATFTAAFSSVGYATWAGAVFTSGSTTLLGGPSGNASDRFANRSRMIGLNGPNLIDLDSIIGGMMGSLA